MGSPDEERIRREARERIASRPSMVLDGDPIEELARAHERHAARIDAIVLSLTDVGTRNFLGDTSEGRAATHNLTVAVHSHDRSVSNTLREQARQARVIATSLREIGRDLRLNEDENVTRIAQAGR